MSDITEVHYKVCKFLRWILKASFETGWIITAVYAQTVVEKNSEEQRHYDKITPIPILNNRGPKRNLTLRIFPFEMN